MTNGLNTRPTDEELAMLWPNTLHTRWGQAGGAAALAPRATTLFSLFNVRQDPARPLGEGAWLTSEDYKAKSPHLHGNDERGEAAARPRSSSAGA